MNTSREINCYNGEMSCIWCDGEGSVLTCGGYIGRCLSCHGSGTVGPDRAFEQLRAAARWAKEEIALRSSNLDALSEERSGASPMLGTPGEWAEDWASELSAKRAAQRALASCRSAWAYFRKVDPEAAQAAA